VLIRLILHVKKARIFSPNIAISPDGSEWTDPARKSHKNGTDVETNKGWAY
jgi:hypothetical protein